jgi:hypothetical protein
VDLHSITKMEKKHEMKSGSWSDSSQKTKKQKLNNNTKKTK